MMHSLQLELKVAGILGKLAREDDTRDKQRQRRHQHKAADDQSREARYKAGRKYSPSTGIIKPMPNTARIAARMPKKLNGR